MVGYLLFFILLLILNVFLNVIFRNNDNIIVLISGIFSNLIMYIYLLKRGKRILNFETSTINNEKEIEKYFNNLLNELSPAELKFIYSKKVKEKVKRSLKTKGYLAKKSHRPNLFLIMGVLLLIFTFLFHSQNILALEESSFKVFIYVFLLLYVLWLILLWLIADNEKNNLTKKGKIVKKNLKYLKKLIVNGQLDSWSNLKIYREILNIN